jgi:predicted DNA-binding transcriptional regulator YafY
MEAGVPVIATPGQGYALDEDYFLPPLRFTTDEATLRDGNNCGIGPQRSGV